MLGINLESVIKAIGLLGVAGIIFAESGFLIGLILPGDTLLFTAGFLASQGFLNMWLLIILGWAAAILGDNFGYAFGRKVGPKIFHREDSLLFHKKHLERAEKFYENHGPKTIVLARFLPVIRTFAPIVAGVGKMNYRVFFFYNVIGGGVWVAGLSLLGYILGKSVENIDRYLLPIIGLIIVASTIPSLYHLHKMWKTKKQEAS